VEMSHPAAEGNDSRSSAFHIFDIHLELASRLKPCQFRLCGSQLDEAWRTGVDRRLEAALGFIPIVSFQVKSSQIKRHLASALRTNFLVHIRKTCHAKCLGLRNGPTPHRVN
jgi:hypothetical protein